MLFNQLGFGPEERRVATESLMSIAADSRMECFTAESHANRAYLETTNAITFIDEDKEVEHPDHCRPLYLMATTNGVQIRKSISKHRGITQPHSPKYLGSCGPNWHKDLGGSHEDNRIWKSIRIN